MGKKKKEDEVELPKELRDELTGKSKPSIIKQLSKKLIKPHKEKVPLTFNTGVAILLFFCYLSITLVSVTTQPQLLIILIPTLYVLVRYIKLEREKYDQKHS